MRALAGFLAVVGLAAGCATAAMIPHATAVEAQKSGVGLETLEHGRGLFLARCGNCHMTPDPGSRSAEQWALILPEMREDSHLSDAEASQVLAFLQALAPN